MTTPVENSGIPLHVWIKTIIVTLIVFIGFLFFLNRWDNRPKTFKEEKIILNETDSRLDFYFLGSSLTRNAFLSFNSLKRNLEKEQLPLNYKFTLTSEANLSHFNTYIKEIEELQPKFLFIESNLVFINMNGDLRERMARLPEYYIKKGIIKLNLNKKNRVEKLNLQQLNILNDRIPEAEIDLTIGKKFKVRDIRNFSEWNKFFAKAGKSSTQIILIEIPRSEEANHAIPQQLRIQIDKLANEIKTSFQIDYVEFPTKLSQKEYFIDRAHMNEKGSDLYCEWFMGEIIKNNLILRE